ncbi:MAG: hypothetical protein ACE5FA_12915, partial [Dehalococcoidia bacterium]
KEVLPDAEIHVARDSVADAIVVTAREGKVGAKVHMACPVLMQTTRNSAIDIVVSSMNKLKRDLKEQEKKDVLRGILDQLGHMQNTTGQKAAKIVCGPKELEALLEDVDFPRRSSHGGGFADTLKFNFNGQEIPVEMNPQRKGVTVVPKAEGFPQLPWGMYPDLSGVTGMKPGYKLTGIAEDIAETPKPKIQSSPFQAPGELLGIRQDSRALSRIRPPRVNEGRCWTCEKRRWERDALYCGACGKIIRSWWWRVCRRIRELFRRWKQRLGDFLDAEIGPCGF